MQIILRRNHTSAPVIRTLALCFLYAMAACRDADTDVGFCIIFLVAASWFVFFLIYSEETLSWSGACSLNPLGSIVACLSSEVSLPFAKSSPTYSYSFLDFKEIAYFVSVFLRAKAWSTRAWFRSSYRTTMISSPSAPSQKSFCPLSNKAWD